MHANKQNPTISDGGVFTERQRRWLHAREAERSCNRYLGRAMLSR
jgi:hypothetical protein